MQGRNEEDSTFGEAKMNIDRNLTSLHHELAQMHEQDSLLFKQLTDIQRSMNTLGNGRYRRSYSSADYLSQRARCRYPALLRSCSEPVFPADMPAGFASVDESEPSEAGETEEDYQNVLLESFSSTVSEPLKQVADLNEPVIDPSATKQMQPPAVTSNGHDVEQCDMTPLGGGGEAAIELWYSTLLKHNSQLWRDTRGNGENCTMEGDLGVIRQEVFL